MSTLLLTALAAFIVWLLSRNDQTQKKWNLSLLNYMFVGASLMWCVDVFFEFRELGLAYFDEQTLDAIKDDSYLGLTVIFAGILVWMLSLLPKALKQTSQEQTN